MSWFSGVFRGRQRGATLVEFAIVCSFILGPAMLLTPVLGKMIAGKNRYEQGLRYAAWERTVWFEARPAHVNNAPVKSSAELALEVQSRIFGRAAAPLRADDRSRRRPQDAPLDYILHRPSAVNLTASRRGYRSWMVDRANNDNAPAYTAAVQTHRRLGGLPGEAEERAMQALEAVTPFEVNTRGVYTTQLSVDLEDVTRFGEFLEGPSNNPTAIDLRLDRHRGRQRQLVLMADGWNVAGPDHARAQARALLSTQFLDNPTLRRVMDVVGRLPLGVTRDIGLFEFGKVDPERVPAHRLGRYQ